MAVGTYQGVAGLAPRLFTLEEETGSHHGHGHVHRTRMLICMHNWGSSLHLPPHRRSSIIIIGARARMHSRSSSCARRSAGAGGQTQASDSPALSHRLPPRLHQPPTGRRMRLQGCCHLRKAGMFANSHSTGPLSSAAPLPPCFVVVVVVVVVS